ncbi:hypothetical protein PENTCL1PPCAC_20422, partial [Pristionchus entomophagus]
IQIVLSMPHPPSTDSPILRGLILEKNDAPHEGFSSPDVIFVGSVAPTPSPAAPVAAAAVVDTPPSASIAEADRAIEQLILERTIWGEKYEGYAMMKRFSKQPLRRITGSCSPPVQPAAGTAPSQQQQQHQQQQQQLQNRSTNTLPTEQAPYFPH